MSYNKSFLSGIVSLVAATLVISSCQKMERPPLKLVLDPDPPTYNPLKSFMAFENNLNDMGESKFTGAPTNISYVAGINGQALKIGADGYLLVKGNDTVVYPNGYRGMSLDTMKNLGSFTLSFWMKGVGPVTGGAQGIFSISNKTQFWGNLDLFLENYDNAADPNAAHLKIHMFNDNVSGGGEEWTAGDEMKLPNTLNKWTHIALTYDAATSKFVVYKDGGSVVNKTLGGGTYGKVKFANVNGMVIGTHQFQTTPSLTDSHGAETWAKSFNGALDQFRLYNRALSTTEITSLFTNKE